MNYEQPCTNCGSLAQQGRWSLRGYFGINGSFCPSCYDKISHDAYGNPTRPKDYLLILLKQPVAKY